MHEEYCANCPHFEFLLMAICSRYARGAACQLCPGATREMTAPPETKKRTGVENCQWKNRRALCASNNSRAATIRRVSFAIDAAVKKYVAKSFIAGDLQTILRNAFLPGPLKRNGKRN